MRPPVVVLVGEGAEKCLQFGDRGRLDGLGAQPLLHRLLEPLGLAAGGGMPGAGVLLDHVPVPELLFEAVAATLASEASQSDGVDHAVVGQGGGRNAVLTCGFAEGGLHDRGGDAVVCGGVQGVAGAVVEPADGRGGRRDR